MILVAYVLDPEYIRIALAGGSSTKSLRPQPKKVGGWLMAIFEKSPSI